MHARSTLIAIIAAAGLAASAATAAPPVGFDFNTTGTAGWTPSDPLAGPFGPSFFGVVDGRYTVTSANLPPLPIFVGAGAIVHDSLTHPNFYTNGVTRVTVRFNTPATNAMIAIRTDTDASVGYNFFLNNNESSIGIDDLGDGGGNIGGAFFPISEHVDYRVEGRIDGDQISVKVWRATDPVPANPQVSVEDSLFPKPGALGFIVYNQSSTFGGTGGSLSASFDDFTFTPLDWDLLDDFATTGMSSWTPIDYTKAGTAQVHAESGAARLTTSQPVSNPEAVAMALNNSAADPLHYADGTIRLIARAGNRDCAIELAARLDGAGFTSVAGSLFPATGQVFVGESVDNNTTILDATTIPVAGFEDADWYLEFTYLADRLSLKVWPVGQPEPAEPQVSGAGATVSAAGRVCIGSERARGVGPIDATIGDVWFKPVTCRADFNSDGTLNSQDFFDFLAVFFAAPPASDFNHDGVVNSQDFFDFLTAFFAGCH